ncbi:hypothetical protein F4806DRAFT_204826 [Annulohypoxylon nitens]|nr:hypothetical protein F4806DRAFT_204826 [Annulohypoxylon nitens]
MTILIYLSIYLVTQAVMRCYNNMPHFFQSNFPLFTRCEYTLSTCATSAMPHELMSGTRNEIYANQSGSTRPHSVSYGVVVANACKKNSVPCSLCATPLSFPYDSLPTLAVAPPTPLGLVRDTHFCLSKSIILELCTHTPFIVHQP